MQLRHLETFLAIVDHGTLTAAAAALFKTQAAVSQDLKALEASLGLDLIDRTGQRVSVTAAGGALVPMARRLLGDVSDTQSEMERIRAGERPIVRLGCLPSISVRTAELIADFRRSHGDVRWSLITALRAPLIEGLRRGQFDLVICEAQVDEDIDRAPLVREPLKIVLKQSHPLAQADALTPADLVDVPYVALAHGMGSTIETQRFFASGDANPIPVVELNDTRLTLHFVELLDGFAVLPTSVLPGGAPLAVVATSPPLERQLSVATLSGRQMPTAVGAFARHLAENWQA